MVGPYAGKALLDEGFVGAERHRLLIRHVELKIWSFKASLLPLSYRFVVEPAVGGRLLDVEGHLGVHHEVAEHRSHPVDEDARVVVVRVVRAKAPETAVLL